MEQLVEQMELSNIQFVTPANSTTYFDEVIGHIEDIVVSDEFQVCIHMYHNKLLLSITQSHNTR